MNLLTRVLMVAIVSLPVSTNGWSADAPAGSYAIRNVEGDHLDVVTPTGQPGTLAADLIQRKSSPT